MSNRLGRFFGGGRRVRIVFPSLLANVWDALLHGHTAIATMKQNRLMKAMLLTVHLKLSFFP